jgi:hypothetical protein
VSIDPPLNEQERSFLLALAETRRMNRSKGPLFVTGTGDFGQGRDEDIIDYNNPHPHQPGLWLQWRPTEDGSALEWDQGEKFYSAGGWMKYLVNNLLAPSALAYITTHGDEDARLQHFTCNHTVNGIIHAQGEDRDDKWRLVVEDNVVRTETPTIVWPGE